MFHTLIQFIFYNSSPKFLSVLYKSETYIKLFIPIYRYEINFISGTLKRRQSWSVENSGPPTWGLSTKAKNIRQTHIHTVVSYKCNTSLTVR